MADDAIITRDSDQANRDEATASASTEPGHLIERANTDGDYGPHGTAAGAVGPIFAGLAVDPSLEKSDSIPADERFYTWHVPKGSGVHVDAIANAAISENDYVVSAGNGEVRSLDTAGGDTVGAVVGQAVEAASSQGDRIEVEV